MAPPLDTSQFPPVPTDAPPKRPNQFSSAPTDAPPQRPRRPPIAVPEAPAVAPRVPPMPLPTAQPEEALYAQPQDAADSAYSVPQTARPPVPPRASKPAQDAGYLTPTLAAHHSVTGHEELDSGIEEDPYVTIVNPTANSDRKITFGNKPQSRDYVSPDEGLDESSTDGPENAYETPRAARPADPEVLPDSPIDLFDNAMKSMEGAIKAGREMRTGKSPDSKEAKRATEIGQAALGEFQATLTEIFKNSDRTLQEAKDGDGNTLFDKVADAAARHGNMDTAPQPPISGFDRTLKELTQKMHDKDMPISEAREAKLSKAGLGPEAPERGGDDSGVFSVSGASVGSSRSDGAPSDDKKQSMGKPQKAEKAAEATAAKGSWASRMLERASGGANKGSRE